MYGGILRHRCQCGWTLAANRPGNIKCGQCGIESHLSEGGRSNRSYGVGDILEIVIDAIGGKQFKRLYRSVFKRDCECSKRKAWLNRIAWRRRYG